MGSFSQPVFVLGAASTSFRRWPERTFRDLAAEAVLGALADADPGGGLAPDSAHFGNCAMGVWGQANIRGQVALDPLMRDGALPAGMPIANVEGGCATGSVALAGAVRDVGSGAADVSLAVGVEKVFVPDDPVKTFALFMGGIDQLHPEEWKSFLSEAGDRGGQAFRPHPARILFLDVHAMQARDHMVRHGTTVEQLAHVASKNHGHAGTNERAQYRMEVPVEAVLRDKPVVDPLTRSMCSPISDGAAALVVVSERWLRDHPGLRDRAIRVRACSLHGGTWRELDEPNVVQRAAPRAYADAGIRPSDVDIAEVHDATSYCEIAATEALGFCPPGEGGVYAESGATTRGGERPVNLSGGLVSKGHPLGATGLGMVHELVLQLRGEAGEHQVEGAPTVGLAQNAGGLVGFDEALCGITILERVV